MEVGRHKTWELSVQLGSAGLGYCGIERAIAVTAYRARQGMSTVKQEASDGKEQNCEHHDVFRSRYLDNIWVCDEQVSLSCP
jgi:hypothetical protein